MYIIFYPISKDTFYFLFFSKFCFHLQVIHTQRIFFKIILSLACNSYTL